MATIGNTTAKGLGQESKRVPMQNDLADQVHHLNQRVAALEKDLAASQQKCENYREFVKQWALKQHSREELERWAMDDDETDCLPLAQFVGELEAMVRDPR